METALSEIPQVSSIRPDLCISASPEVNGVPFILLITFIPGLGVAVLLANWTRTDLSDSRFANAAEDQLNYLLNVAPQTSDGAISHRTSEVQLW